MNTRREMLEMLAASAAFGMMTSGCRTARPRENAALRELMRKYVAEGLYRGCVATSNRGDLACEGFRTMASDSDPMAPDSLFDLASIGKTQTAALCALLYADGRLDVDAPFTDYLPEHVLAHEFCRVTVRDLATHSGGFDNSKPYEKPEPSAFYRRLFTKRPVRPRGERFEYACSNFIYLGLIVEKLTGVDLDTAARRMLWGPLGMADTTWNTVVGNPNAVEFHISTYGWPARKIGEHNDRSAHYSPRPAGNGSCFSTAPDMLKFTEDLLAQKRFPKAYYDLLFTPSFERGGVRRSFGFDMKAPNSSTLLRMDSPFSDRTICHTGWTGGILLADPERAFAGVMLGSQIAGKDRTMEPRMRLMEAMI